MKLSWALTLIKLILLSLILFSLEIHAASCCGGGVAAPALVVGDDKAQVTTSYSYSQVKEDVDTEQTWYKRQSPETVETLRIEGAHIFKDRYQAGFTVPVVRRERYDESSTGLGDVAATLAYEYLTDWDYHPWRPKGLAFLQLTLPTGKPIQEAEETYQLDSTGRGFWALGVGTLLVKNFGSWDAHTSFEIHQSFARKYANSRTQGELKPGVGGTFTLGGGYSEGMWRGGVAVAWSYEDPVNVSGTINSRGSVQRYATASVSLSCLLPQEWTANATYADQTIFGNPTNTNLSKSFTVLLQKRWLR